MSAEREQTPGAVQDVTDVLYKTADGVQLYLDIIRPATIPEQPMPVVIYIHGGGWEAGRRDGRSNDFLAEAGFFTVSIDYRLSSQAIFPAQLEDVRDAVLWLRAHADDYHIDPERIGVWGHSAGGHLSSLLGISAAMRVSGEPYAGVQAVASLSGPVDLLQMGGRHNEPDSPESRLLGGPVQQRVTQARQANPISYLNADVPPFLLIHGTADSTVPFMQSELLFHALREINADVELVPLSGENHNFNANGEENSQLIQLAGKFFLRILVHGS